jgi:hypothetical protein
VPLTITPPHQRTLIRTMLTGNFINKLSWSEGYRQILSHTALHLIFLLLLTALKNGWMRHLTCVHRWIKESASNPVEVYAASKRMTTRAAARVLFGVDIWESPGSSETTHSDRHNNPLINSYMARDLDDFGAGFFALPIPFPGTAFYKVSNSCNSW